MEHFFAGSPNAAAASTVHAILEAVREGRPFCQFARSSFFECGGDHGIQLHDVTHVCLFQWPAEPRHFQIQH